MKLRTDMTINGKLHKKGTEISWKLVYPFFLFHMLGFGASGFFLAYSDSADSVFFLYLHGGFAILVYLIFYLALFGVDEVKWMFINGALGLLGISAQIDWILALFGKHVRDYSVIVHVIPFLYYILYTFLIHQMVLDITGARDDEVKKKQVDRAYVGLSIPIYGVLLLT